VVGIKPKTFSPYPVTVLTELHSGLSPTTHFLLMNAWRYTPSGMVTIRYVLEYGKRRQNPPGEGHLENDYLNDQWEDNIKKGFENMCW
jgi:hypothetical protein